MLDAGGVEILADRIGDGWDSMDDPEGLPYGPSITFDHSCVDRP